MRHPLRQRRPFRIVGIKRRDPRRHEFDLARRRFQPVRRGPVPVKPTVIRAVAMVLLDVHPFVPGRAVVDDVLLLLELVPGDPELGLRQRALVGLLQPFVGGREHLVQSEPLADHAVNLEVALRIRPPARSPAPGRTWPGCRSVAPRSDPHARSSSVPAGSDPRTGCRSRATDACRRQNRCAELAAPPATSSRCPSCPADCRSRSTPCECRDDPCWEESDSA